MRENRTYGSEGGEGPHPFPTPIEASVPAPKDRNWMTASCAGMAGLHNVGTTYANLCNEILVYDLVATP